MKRIFKLYLLLNLFCTLTHTQNLGAYLGSPPSSSITTKKGIFSFNINYTTLYSFDQKLDINHYKRLAINIPLKSGFELALSSTLGEEDNHSEMVGFNYNIKKRKFGITTHIASHNITIDDDMEINYATEYGISVHARFRKKDIRPFLHYSYTQFDEDIDPHHSLTLGAISRVNKISIGTHLVSSLEDLINNDNKFAYLGITIGFVID